MMSCEPPRKLSCASQHVLIKMGRLALACELFFTFVSSPYLTTPVTDLWMLMSFLGLLVENMWVEEDLDQYLDLDLDLDQ